MLFDRSFAGFYAISRFVDQIAVWMTVVLVALFTVVVLLQVFMRYVLSAALPWPEEFARYALVWMTFIAGSCALRRGFHVGIDYFMEKLPSIRLRALLKVVALVGLCYLFVIMIIYGIDLAERASRRTTPGMGISQGWFHTGFVIGSALMLVQAAEHLVRALNAFLFPSRATAADAAPITTSDGG